MDQLRARLLDKETAIEKKTKALVAAQNERRDMENELKQVQDQMDIKERKITVLQRKVGTVFWINPGICTNEFIYFHEKSL